MARTLINSQRAFALAVVATVACALSPWGGVASVLGEVFRIGFMPFTDVGNRLASAMRSPPASRDFPRGSESDIQYIEELKQRAMENERLYLVERERVKSLQGQIDQLQRSVNSLEDLKRPVRLQLARIGMRSPVDGLGEVTLNVGSSAGVTVDTVAVYDAVHLVGRVTSVSPYQSTLTPLASKGASLIEARALPHDRKSGGTDNSTLIQLSPQGDGTLVAKVERIHVINPGDDVMLFDTSWPESAQGLHIGYVESVKADDMQPLRNVVMVRPAFQVSQVGQVVLRIELGEGEQPVVAGASKP